MEGHLKEIESQVEGIWPKGPRNHRLQNPAVRHKLFGLIEDYTAKNPKAFWEAGVTEIISIAMNEHLIKFLQSRGLRDENMIQAMRERIRAELAINRITQTLIVFQSLAKYGIIPEEQFQRKRKAFDDALIHFVQSEKLSKDRLDASAKKKSWKEDIGPSLENERMETLILILRELKLSTKYGKRIHSVVSTSIH